jgi:polyisoprenoid-binding protein YceI
VSTHEGRWVLVPERSRFAFRHKSLWGLVNVRGTFTEFSGQGEVEADGAIRGTLTVAAATLSTKNARRDEHLRSDDFFKVAAHPDITYVVHGGEIDADSRLSVSGDITVAGVTRPLVMTAHIDDISASSAMLSAEVTFDRAAFDMRWNRLGMITGPAHVEVAAAFIRQSG